MFRGVVKFEAAQDAASLGRRECLIQRASGMDRQIVLHDADAGRVGILDVDEFAHAVRVVYGGAAVCNLDVTPATMRVEGNEETDSAVATVLVIVTLALSRLSRNRLTHLADELGGVASFIDEIWASTNMAGQRGAPRRAKAACRDPPWPVETTIFVAGLHRPGASAKLKPADIVIMDNLSSHKGAVCGGFARRLR